MKTKNVIIGILDVLLAGSLIWNYISNRTAIDDKIMGKSETAKIAIRDLNQSIEKEVNTKRHLKNPNRP